MTFNLKPGKYVFGDPALILDNFNKNDIPKTRKVPDGYIEDKNMYYFKVKEDLFDYIERKTLYKNTSKVIIFKEQSDFKPLRNKSEKVEDHLMYNYGKIEVKDKSKLIFETSDNDYIYIKTPGEPRATLMLSSVDIECK